MRRSIRGQDYENGTLRASARSDLRLTRGAWIHWLSIRLVLGGSL